MIAGDIPGKTQTLSVAIYDAVESGNGAVARWLVLVVSALALLLLWPSAKLTPGVEDGRSGMSLDARIRKKLTAVHGSPAFDLDFALQRPAASPFCLARAELARH